MATPPVAPSAPAVGNAIASGTFGSLTAAALAFLLAPPRCMVYQTAAGTFTTSGTTYAVGFDTEAWDTDSMHSTASNTSRLVATTSGLYVLQCQLAFAANATGVRSLDIRKNAAGNPASGTLLASSRAAAISGVVTTISLAIDLQMAAGDYVELFGTHTSGGSLNSSTGVNATFAQMRWVASS